MTSPPGHPAVTFYRPLYMTFCTFKQHTHIVLYVEFYHYSVCYKPAGSLSS